jgi:ABC-2 type transport system ATP-binding protein
MEKVCQRVGIIYQGRLLAEDQMHGLLTNLVGDRQVQIDLEELPADLIDRIKTLEFVQDAAAEDGTLVVTVPKSGRDYRSELSRYLIGQQLVPLSIQERSLSLEEAFITITKENVDRLAGAARTQ